MSTFLFVLSRLLQMIPLDSFMAHSADGRLVPVVPGGQNVSLTFTNRTEYVEKALDYRLHEMDSQVCCGVTGGTVACRYTSQQLQKITLICRRQPQKASFESV